MAAVIKAQAVDDPLLLPFFEAQADTPMEALALDQLMGIALPVIEENLGKYHLRSLQQGYLWSEEDARNEICAIIVNRVRRRKLRPDSKPITDFRAYTAVVTHNFCHFLLSQKNTERAKLKRDLRYLFAHCPELARWKGAHTTALCGFAAWKRHPDPAEGVETEQLSQIIRHRLVALDFPIQEPGQLELRELVTSIFRAVNAPLAWKELVRHVARIQRVSRTESREISFEEWLAESQHPLDEQNILDVAVEKRELIKLIWAEINLLPRRQAQALLLGMRSEQGRSPLVLFEQMGVATVEEIAQALEITTSQLKAILTGRALKDAEIARHFHLTRQQIINLRSSARKRLERRLEKNLLGKAVGWQ